MGPVIHHFDILLIVRANYLAHQSYCNNYTLRFLKREYSLQGQ